MKKKKARASRAKPRRARRPVAASAPAAALLGAALRAQAEGVFIAGRRTASGGLKIIFANDQFCAITGYTAAELTGRAHDFVHVAATDRARLARWLQAAKSGQPLNGEGYLARKDGSTIYAAWSFSRLRAPGRSATHIVATYRDMTEKRSLQEALVHAQRLDAVGRLAGGVAHDFNNLISVINGYCEMLAAQVAEIPHALHEVTEIHKAGRKAAVLTRQLLAFGRRQPMDVRVINFNHIIRENAEILRRLLGDAGQLVLDLDERLGNVRTDPAQFQQVLLNLTINARDALRDHGRVTITTANREVKDKPDRRPTDVPPGRYVVLTVTDNGTGMDTETQKHLFEPFFTTKPDGKGTGLGLSLVYGVVQQSAGFIQVRSQLTVGSTFEIMLPEQRGPGDAGMSSVPFAVPSIPATRGHETVLLVEEDEVLRKMVAGMLTADGYRVTDVSKSSDAVEKHRSAQGKPVQLLIANIAGDSEKLAKELLAERPDLRVLNACNQGAQQTFPWLPPGRQTSLPKPFALSELLKAARKLLDT